jgi:hypothetical protein
VRSEWLGTAGIDQPRICVDLAACEALSRQLLTAETLVLLPDILCRLCSKHIGTQDTFSSEYFGFYLSVYILPILHISLSVGLTRVSLEVPVTTDIISPYLKIDSNNIIRHVCSCLVLVQQYMAAVYSDNTFIYNVAKKKFFQCC